jgi:hypothetical protein
VVGPSYWPHNDGCVWGCGNACEWVGMRRLICPGDAESYAGMRRVMEVRNLDTSGSCQPTVLKTHPPYYCIMCVAGPEGEGEDARAKVIGA